MSLVKPDFASFAHRYESGQAQIVWTSQISDSETPISVMRKLAPPTGSGAFLLESMEGVNARGRYSLIGLAPDLVWRVRGDLCEINRTWGENPDAFTRCTGSVLDELQALVAAIHMDDLPPDLAPALACLVGYMDYESIGLRERLPPPKTDRIGAPDMLFVRPSLLVVFDRLRDELFLVAPVFPNQLDAQSAYDRAIARIEETQKHLCRPLPDDTPTHEPQADLKIEAVMSAQDYETMVRRAKEYILAGDIFQVVLAQRFTAEFSLPPFELYRALRRINPSPFLYYLDLPDDLIITGASPEILVRVRDGEVTIRPLAGTRPRGANALEDAQNHDSLLADPKELAEHLMLLDLGRNDVGRVAKPASVMVTERNKVEFYSHVMHIVSNVRGLLDDGKSAIDALFAGFPAGTLSGAPKIRALEIINQLEQEKRGPYGGAIIYFSPNGSMDSCITLRTAVIKGHTLHIQAGAGIVADSDPASEQSECIAKSRAIVTAAHEALERARVKWANRFSAQRKNAPQKGEKP